MEARRRLHADTLLLLPVILLLLAVGVAPFFEAFRSSLFHDMYGETSFAGLDNYRDVVEDAGFGYSLNITVVWALLNVVLSTVFGFLLALALGRRHRPLVHGFLLIPMAVPVYIAIPLWRAFLHGNGGVSVITRLTGLEINLLMDPAAGFIGAMVVSLWLSIPMTAFVFAGHMRKVGRQVLDAARLDGAGPGAVARHIYIPEIRESLAAMAVLNFISSFKEFTLVYLMTAGGPPLVQGITDRYIIGATTTLGMFLYEVFLQTPDWGISGAYAVVMTFLVVVAILIWVIIRGPNPRRRMLLLAALVLVPGGSPALWIIAAGYLVPVIVRRDGRRMVPVLFIVHLGITLWALATRGFLAGFHPGIIVAAMVFAVPGARSVLSASAGSAGPGKFRSRKSRCFGTMPGLGAATAGSAGGFILVTAIVLYMLLWMSLSRVSACYVDRLLPETITLANYGLLFAGEGLGRIFLNTFIVAGSTALLIIPVVFPAAVYLDGRGRKTTLAFLAGLQILGIAGGMHTLVPLYGVFRALGLLDTWIPLILIYLYHSIPFSLFILTAFLGSLPDSFRDLARLEGMGRATYAFRVLLPLSLPQVATVAILAFISGWNGFQAPLLFLNSENLYTISLKLYGYVGSIGSGAPLWNLFAAASVINTLLVGILFLQFRAPMMDSPLGDFEE